MANIRTGSIVSDIRGRVGTEVYSRNRGGAYVKSYVAPVQPLTTVQQEARANMANVVSQWNSFSDSERIEWMRLAEQFNNEDYFGKKYSGRSLFIQRYLNNHQIKIPGFRVVPTAVNKYVSSSTVFGYFSLTESEVKLSYSDSDNISDLHWVFYLSPPVNSNVMAFNSTRFTKVGSIVDMNLFGSGFIDVTSTYQSIFGSLSGKAGMKVFFKLGSVYEESGQSSVVRSITSQVIAP